MTATLQPFGLIPIYAPGTKSTATRYDNGIPSGYNTAILEYQPVKLNTSGQIVPVSATSDDFIGSFAGVTYFDGSGVPHSINQWIAGTTLAANQPVWVWVYDDPTMKYKIQCDGTLAQSVGGQVNLTAANLTNGSTLVGLSQATAQASSLSTSGQAQLRITDLDLSIGNAWGDAFTIINVQIAKHQFVANKVAV
jgi:hypothetical protein